MLEHRRTRTVERPRSLEPIGRYLAKANAHLAAGRFQKANRNLQLALELSPGDASAHYHLGLLTCKTESPGPAIPHFVSALRAAPERPAYWFALVGALLEVDRVGEAHALMERFRDRGLSDDESRSTFKDVLGHAMSLAQARFDTHDFPASETLLNFVLALDETHSGATYLAGVVAAQTGRLQQAFDLFSIVIDREPENGSYLSSLGAILARMEDHGGAIWALEKAIALAPDLALAHSNFSGVLERISRHGLAVSHARQAIALDPGFVGAYINLGSSLKSLGHLPEAIDSFDRALALDPSNMAAHSNRLFAKLYAEGVSAVDYAADARAFGLRFAEPFLRRRPFANDRNLERRLRIGFVSGDLYTHAVARFIEPFLRHLDRTRLDVRAYMTRAKEDEISASLRTLFDGWHNVSGMSDDAVADLIEADAIDILVDLSGHSAGHRLAVFARKPAPVQVTWIGHPATTGLRAIDYRLTDRVHDRPGLSEAMHTEALWRLPGVSATYQLRGDPPEVRGRAPFEDNGYVTFGVLNRFEKISDRALQTWAGMLHALPDARLFMVIADVGEPDILTEVEERLAKAGLPLDRVRLHPRVSTGYFALYHEIDIALDSFPYNGGTTSCDTLYMGVPFVTLRGDSAVASAGAAVLTAVGLEELVAETPEAYAACALDLARDPDRLRDLRAGLRARMLASPLMDHARLAADIGDAFRAMWRRWVDDNRSA
ncbi:tetratricopeptide repeat protein [Methylobacterium sp. 77]|uniref:O-linked N-acetylglucosamine transferase family protein n=1 Tax=Methylobacterium sp. 77 TaxID=1101192 RepID=UPI00036E969C|nr:tetratricopeptide repeat protein [Methylobacterium sp. 77]